MLVLTLKPGQRTVFFGANGDRLGVFDYDAADERNQQNISLGFNFSRDIRILRESLVKDDKNEKHT